LWKARENEMTERKTVLVSGATGNQGGAVAEALLKRGHVVRALSRRVDSEPAQRLAAKGAQIVAGSFDDPASVVAAARGADTAFLMGSYFEAGPEGETRQGIAAADAFKEAGVGHLIYSSVASANRQTGVPHFDSKFRVEQHLMTLGVPYTISAPAAFMENAIAPWSIGALLAGKQLFSLPPNRPVQLVAVADIGAFVAILIERKEKILGHRYEIAGDELTSSQQATILSEAMGRPIEYQTIPLEALRQQSEDQALMADWLERFPAGLNRLAKSDS
jgi:uncharacterized protein YbjT (DUF2867 family)